MSDWILFPYKRHFHIDFNIFQFFRYTLPEFFLVAAMILFRMILFARDLFTWSRSAFCFDFIFNLFTCKTLCIQNYTNSWEISRAKALTQQFGNSALDFFKTYSDKLFLRLPKLMHISPYRVNRNFAVVLEIPWQKTVKRWKNALSLSVNIVMKMVLKKLLQGVKRESARL